jgi:hypothetical protein
MNGWDRARLVEVRAMQILQRFLRDNAHDGRLVLFNKGALAKALQAEYGDAAFNSDADTVHTVEMKAEERWTGNLFLETWSNRNLDFRDSHAERGSNPGWLLKQRADLLLYYFLDNDHLIVVPLYALKRWAFGCTGQAGRIYAYPEKIQRKYEQANDTVGRVVPVADLAREIPSLRVFRARQLELRFPEVAA